MITFIIEYCETRRQRMYYKKLFLRNIIYSHYVKRCRFSIIVSKCKFLFYIIIWIKSNSSVMLLQSFTLYSKYNQNSINIWSFIIYQFCEILYLNWHHFNTSTIKHYNKCYYILLIMDRTIYNLSPLTIFLLTN